MSNRILPRSSRLSLFALLLLSLLSARGAFAASPNVVISQVYGGAGCGTVGCSTYKNDYIELFNRGTSAVSLNGWSVQYAAATGTAAWTVTNLTNVSLQPGQYYLVGESASANGVTAIPTPDVSGSIAMSATAGKVALLSSTTALNGACPASTSLVDVIGYGATANCFETAVAPAPSTTTADVRAGGGCTDSDNNSTDFAAAAPTPRNTSTKVTGVTATGGVSQVSLAWTGYTGALTTYNVKRATATGGPYTTLASSLSSTTTSYTDSTATNGTPYFYVISVNNCAGDNATSAEVSATPLAQPAVLSIAAGVSPTNAQSVSYTVTFNVAVTGVDTSDFALAASGVAGATVTSVTGGGTTRTVTVDSGSGNGTLGLNLVDDDTIINANGTKLGGTGTGNGDFTGGVYTIDKTAPVISSVTVPANGTYVAGQNLDFAINFSEAVIVNTGGGTPRLAVTLDTGGTVFATYLSGSGTSILNFRYTVVTGNADPTGIALASSFDPNGGTIQDAAGNTATATLNGVGSTTAVLVDAVAPTVSSINRAGTNPANATSVSFTVTFSEAVTGVDATDFALPATGVTGAAITGVTGSGTTYTVTVGTGTGDGTLGLNFVDDDSVIDAAGNRAGGTGTGNANFTGQTYSIDKTAPAVLSINRTAATPTAATSLGFTVTFSETVTGVDAADFALTTTGLTGASITSVTAVSGTAYTVAVDPGTGSSGTVRLDLISGASVADAAGNAPPAFNSGQSYTIDRNSPSVVSVTRANASPTKATSVTFTVTFSTAVSGVDATDFALTGLTGTIGTPSTSDGGTTWSVTVSGIAGNGSLRLDVLDDDTIVSSTSIPLGGAGAGNGAYSAGEVYTIDQTAPSVQSIAAVGSTLTNTTSTVSFTVTFSEVVTGVDTTDFVVTATGVTGATIGTVSGTGSTRTVAVNSGTGDGTIRLDVVDDDTIIDPAGNPLGGPGAANGNFTTGASFTLDRTVPVTSSIVRASTNPSNAASVNFTVTFSESVTGVDAADFVLTTSGVTGSVTSVTGSGASYTVVVGSLSGSGTLRLDVKDDDSIADAAGNKLGGTGLTNGDFTTGQSYTIDRTAPAVSSIVRASTDPTSATSVSYSVTFSEAVTGVDKTDFLLTASGVNGATVDTVTGSGTTYTVSVSTGTGSGSLRLDVTDDDTIVDSLGNPLGGTGAGNGNFTTGQSYTVQKAPVAPTGLTATAGNGRVTLTWTAASGASTYNVKRGTVSGGPYTTIATGIATTTYDDTTAVNGTQYFYVVSSVNTVGESANSSEVTATPLLPAPTGVTATAGNNSVAIAWTAVTNATGYSVKRGTTTGGPYTNVATNTPGTTYTDNTATNGTTYFYVVTALSATTESSPSSEVSATPAPPPTPGAIVISQVYGGGGNTGSVYKNDYIELFNRGGSPVSINGWSVQYASATGTSWTVTNLTGTINPGKYYLVQELAGAGGTTSLPAPDAIGTTGMSASAGKVALLNTNAALTVSCPTGASLVDLVGYGTANCVEGSGAAPIPATINNANGSIRAANGCTDSNNNATDFSYATATPRNSATAANVCPVTAPNSPPTITAPADPIATVTQNANPFTVVLNGSDDGSIYNWSAAAGTGVSTVTVSGGQGTSQVTYTVTLVAGFSGSASFTASLTDNVNPAVSTAVRIQVNTIPAVTSIVRASADPTAASSVNYTVTFSEAVTGVDATDFAITATTAGAGVTAVTGSGSSYTVTVSTGTGSGTVRLDLVDDDSIRNSTNTPLGGTGAGNGNFTGPVYTIDRTNPTVSSIVRASTDPTSAASVNYTVTFSTAVTGVDASDFTLTVSGVNGATVGSVAGSGSTYTVSVSTGTGSGTIRLDLIDDDTIADGLGNKLGGTGAGNGNFTTGQSYTVQKVPAAPTGLTATAGNGRVTLAWTAASGAVTYNVKRATVTGGPYTTIATAISATTYDDTTAVNGTQYFYVVSSVNAAGESANSSEASARPTLPAPTGVTATAGSSSLVISWTAVTNATGYSVKRGTTTGGPYTNVATNTTANSFTDTTVTNGTTYFYVVTALSAASESSPSAEVSATPVAAATPGVIVISQVYGGGGNSGATYKNDYIELFNRGGSPVTIDGWSVQYGSATGTTWSATTLTGTINPGRYFLIQEAAGTAGTVNLPTPDATGTLPLGATAGKIALSNTSAVLSGACPAGLVDLVGFGSTANCFEGSAPTPAPSNTTAVLRAGNGCTDTNNNATDFTAVAPAPRNSSSPASICGAAPANNPPAITAPANPVATVTQGTSPTVVINGSDDNSVYNWSATPGNGVASVAVSSGQGTARVSYTVTLQSTFTGTATFTATLSDNVNPSVSQAVNIQVNAAGSGNNAPVINAPANPAATVTQDDPPFPVSVSGTDDGAVYNWSATPGTGIANVTVASGQGTATVTYTVTLSAGFNGTASFTANLSDNVNPTVSQAVGIRVNAPAGPASHVVISQLYTGGGNTGAAYKNDYVELYNPTASTVDLTGWSLQYQAATSTGTYASIASIGATIGSGQYYLVALASGGTIGADLPPSNASGSINMSGTAGKIALVRSNTPLTGVCSSDLASTNLVDFIGYGAGSGTTVNCSEGNAPAPTFTSANALFRKAGGATDTNNNLNDFTVSGAAPRSTAAISEIGPSIVSTDPLNNGLNAPRDASMTVNFSEPVHVDPSWFNISCVTTGLHNDGTVGSGGTRTLIITPNRNFTAGEQCTVTIYKDRVHDDDLDDSAPNTDTLLADYSWTFTVSTGSAPLYTADVHITMGNPSGAVQSATFPDNYLMLKPEMAISYNRDKGTPNWVSWHLSDDWLGSLTRVDTFRADPDVRPEWYRVESTDYFASGFDRGHMDPNADRTSSIPINQATFLMTNMIPQAPDNNQGPWAAMENDLRTIVRAGNELYIVSGPAGIGGTGSNGGVTSTIANGRVTVPAFTWKVVLVLPKASGDDVSRVTPATRTIAVILPNKQGIRADDWHSYLTTVDQVETLTGYDFFSNVPPAIQNSIEAGIDGNNPPGAASKSSSGREDTPQSVTLDAVSPSNATLTYTIVAQPAHGSLSGSGASRTYTPLPDYNGPDSFTYTATDGTKTSNTATVTITVLEVNDPPVAAADAKSTGANTPFTFPASDLTVNDSPGPANESSQTLTVVAVNATTETHGTVVLNNGQVGYTPDTDYAGPASFTYRVCDNGVSAGVADSLCATGMVNLTVVCSPASAATPLPSYPAVCAGSRGNIAAVPATMGATYSWSITNGSITSGQGSSAITYTAGTSGAVGLSLTMSTANLCNPTTTRTGSVAIKAVPTAVIPDNVYACPGSSATVQVVLTGTAPFTIVWSDRQVQTTDSLSASREIMAGVNTRLSIVSVTDASCTSGVSNEVAIIVSQAPRIVDQTTEVKIERGATAHLVAYVSGQDLRFQWYQGVLGDKSKPLGDNFADLTTPALSETTLYWLEVSNPCATIRSQPMIVTVPVVVAPPPPPPPPVVTPGRHRASPH